MGQKVNPIGLRLGINRTWDSPLVRRGRRIRQAAPRGHQDPQGAAASGWPRPASPRSSSSARPSSARVTIHTARPGVVIGKKGADIEKLRGDLAKMTERRGAPEHRRDPQARDRRQAGRREHRPAARAPRRLPPRHEARGAVGHAAGRPGHPHQLLAAAWAAPRSPAWSGTARAACRCTRCAPTSTTASPTALHHLRHIGVKVWVFKGEILAHDPMAHDKRAEEAAPQRTPRASSDRAEGRVSSHAATQAHQVPQGATRAGSAAPPRAAPTLDFGAFGLKAMEPDRAHRAPDRGRPPRDHAPHQARRPRVDPHLPRRAGVEEAGRGPHGQGQGRARVLGGPRQARPHHVRARRRAGAARRARRSTLAAAKLPIKTALRRPRRRRWLRRRAMKASDLRAKTAGPAQATSSASCARSSSTCASSGRPASSRSPRRVRQVRRDIARIKTRAGASKRRPRLRSNDDAEARPAKASSSATRWTRPSSCGSSARSCTRSTRSSSVARRSITRTTRATPSGQGRRDACASASAGRCPRRKTLGQCSSSAKRPREAPERRSQEQST